MAGSANGGIAVSSWEGAGRAAIRGTQSYAVSQSSGKNQSNSFEMVRFWFGLNAREGKRRIF